MNPADLFFQYEEAVELYLETRQEALRLRAISLRGQLLDELVCRCEAHSEELLANGQLQVPKWLQGEN